MLLVIWLFYQIIQKKVYKYFNKKVINEDQI